MTAKQLVALTLLPAIVLVVAFRAPLARGLGALVWWLHERWEGFWK